MSGVSDLVKKKTDFNAKVTEIEGKISSFRGLATNSALTAIENKIPNINSLVKTTDFNSKISEVEGKIPSFRGLATNSALTAVENKIPNVSNLVKTTDFNSKISEVEGKIPSIIDLATNSTSTAVKNKIPDVSSLVKKKNVDTELKKISDRVTRHLQIENELKKFQKFDAAYFRGKSHFEEDGTQKYLVFQPLYKYFKRIAVVGNVNYIDFWKSKGLSNERLNSLTASNYKITSELSFYGTKRRVEFNGSCLRQDKVTHNHGKIVNIYIVYEISKNYNISSYPTLENCLFGAVSLTKNANIDQYKYSGYGIGFDRHGEFSFGNKLGKNCINFGAELSSSSSQANNKKNILVLGKDFVQGTNGTTIYAEKLLSLHYNRANSYLFINGAKIHKFTAKDTEIVASPLCLGNISKDISVDNMKKNKIKWICL